MYVIRELPMYTGFRRVLHFVCSGIFSSQLFQGTGLDARTPGSGAYFTAHRISMGSDYNSLCSESYC